jgi:hypothetical protein
MKNVKSNLGSFATTKLQDKRHSLLAIALIVTAMLLLGCSKKAEAQESKGSSATGSAKTGAYNSESDFQIDWDTNVKDGVIITEYIGIKNEVNIPPSIQNSPVTGIGDWAFRENKNITKVTIPNGVTSIGVAAFWRCTSLTSVNIPNSITSIGVSAFNNCANLTSITIPDSVVSNIGENTFLGCISLTSAIIGNNVTSIGKAAFEQCTSLTNLTIGNSVTSIGDWAFYKCNLTSVIIPDSVTRIGEHAFNGCTNLTSVTFQGTITSNNFDYDSFGHSGSFSGYNGDIREKYLANDGGPGTYKRFAGGEVWKKQ